MNEPNTPLGYIEYPRDPKFLKLSDIERLRLAGEGYCGLFWIALITWPLANVGGHFGPPRPASIAVGFVLTMIMMVVLRSSLVKTFQSQGWNQRYVVWPVVLFGAVAGIHVSGLLPFLPMATAVYATIFLTAILVQRVAATEFKRHGLKMPKRLDYAKLQTILEEEKLAKVLADSGRPGILL